MVERRGSICQCNDSKEIEETHSQSVAVLLKSKGGALCVRKSDSFTLKAANQKRGRRNEEEDGNLLRGKHVVDDDDAVFFSSVSNDRGKKIKYEEK